MEPRERSLRIQGLFLAAALLVQYALGMYINIFIAFPENASKVQLWEFAWSHWAIATHIILAILILLTAIATFVQAMRLKNSTWMTPSSVGLLAIIAAGASGAAFVPSQWDVYSYTMSIAFLVAELSYLWGILKSQPRS